MKSRKLHQKLPSYNVDLIMSKLNSFFNYQTINEQINLAVVIVENQIWTETQKSPLKSSPHFNSLLPKPS